jgi:glycosyltransferase involved in cell wall biosynthesis
MSYTAEQEIHRKVEPHRGLRVLVALPALDEARTVAEVIRAIPHDLPGVSSVQVLVVDDGSSDATAEEAQRAGAHVIRHSQPRGVGAAFTTALRYGVDEGFDLIVSIDADGQFDPADIQGLIEPLIAGDADFTTASRFIDPQLEPEMPYLKRWGNRMMARLVSRLAGQTFHDVSCGMRGYSRKAALSLNPFGRFTYTQEVFLNLAFKQLRIVEVPIAVRGEREHGESRVASSLWRYGVRTSGIIFRCYRDYKPMLFFGAIAAAAFLLAFGLGGFLLFHYLSTGGFSPHKWAGFTAATLAALGTALLFMGLLGDMLNRHRIYLEELLYRQRDRSTDRERREHRERRD